MRTQRLPGDSLLLARLGLLVLRFLDELLATRELARDGLDYHDVLPVDIHIVGRVPLVAALDEDVLYLFSVRGRFSPDVVDIIQERVGGLPAWESFPKKTWPLSMKTA